MEAMGKRIAAHWLLDHDPDQTWCEIPCLARLLTGRNTANSRAEVRRYAWQGIRELAGEQHQATVIRAIAQDPAFAERATFADARRDNVIAWKILRHTDDFDPYLLRQIKRNLLRGQSGYAANRQLSQQLRGNHLPVPKALAHAATPADK